jgi:hypothetical protein
MIGFVSEIAVPQTAGQHLRAALATDIHTVTADSHVLSAHENGPRHPRKGESLIPVPPMSGERADTLEELC